MFKRISVSVYRNAEHLSQRCDCTNGGITSRYTYADLYSGDRNECVADAEKSGKIDSALYLNKRILWNEKHYFAEPLRRGKGVQMFGGNFVYTCDSRFREMCEDIAQRPLPVHDRYELDQSMGD